MAASLPPASLPGLHLLPRAQIVATRGRGMINTAGAGGTNYTRFESNLFVNIGPRPAQQLRLLYANRYLATVGESPSNASTPNADYTLESAVVANGFWTAGTFNGTKTPSIMAGTAMVVSDVLPLRLSAGQQIALRSAAIVPSASLAVVGHPLSSSLFTNAYSTSATSQVYSTSGMTTPSGGTASGYGFVPLAVIGVPDQRHVAVMIWGDSIMFGQGDTSAGDALGFVGWVERGLNGAAAGSYHVPFVNVSRTGARTDNFSNAYVLIAPAVLPYATHVICGYSTNDVGINSLATMQANCQYGWLTARNAGCKVYHTKMTPKTTSTDSWATAANQTIVAGYETSGTGSVGVRAQFNSWLDTQVAAGNLDGVIDPNSVVEDQSNPGKWVTNATANYATSDGLHPSSAMHIAMAAALKPTVQTWTA